MKSDSAGKTLFISELREGMQVQDLFLISRKTLAETKNGKPYLALALMDRTGEMEARVWDDAPRFDRIAKTGAVVRIDGQVKAFRDKLQLNLSSLVRLEEDELDLSHFVAASSRPVKEMQEELIRLVEGLADPALRNLLATLFSGALLTEFSRAPAAKQMHHAYLGGLLEHTLSVAGLADLVCRHYLELDRDLLIAGALLHDLGKIREFHFTTVPFDYTDRGRLVGHLVLGSEIVREKAAAVPELTVERLDQLIHLILSHHGRHEFGAPCLPMTAEAILLHHIDDIDAKMNFIARLSQDVEPGHQEWSDYQRVLERFLLLRGPGHHAQTQSAEAPEIQGQSLDSEDDPGDVVDPQTKQGKLF